MMHRGEREKQYRKREELNELVKKVAKLVKDTKAVLIYGPYPKNNPEGIYQISFSENKKVWVKNFQELVDLLCSEIGEK